MDISSHEPHRAERLRMSVRSVALGAVMPQPWRNGGGRTRELLAWPAAEGWQLRISVADIDADGPFSAFDDVRRWFAVVEGAGVALGFADGERVCRRGDSPLAFGGAAAPSCRLLDGPTQDLNLMTRSGDATMQTVLPGADWNASFAIRALYSAVAGQWSDGRGWQRVVAGTLLWEESETTPRCDTRSAGHTSGLQGRSVTVDPGGMSDRGNTSVIRGAGGPRASGDSHGGVSTPAGTSHPWRFDPDDRGPVARAWWLGFTPQPKVRR
jgi:environmental stress-induced protein Ves